MSALLLLFLLAHVSAQPVGSIWPPSTAVQVVAALKAHYHSGCVFLLYSEDGSSLDQLLYLVTLEKSLAQLGITTAITHLEGLYRTFDWNCCLRNRALFVCLSDSPGTKLALQKTWKTYNIASPRWLMFLSNGTLEDFFTEVDVPFDCEFLVARMNLDEEVTFTEVYRTRDRQTHSSKWGSWNAARGLSPSQWSFYTRRRDLKGALFKIGYVSVPSVFTVTHEGNEALVDGFFGHVCVTLQERMNITTEFLMSKDGSWNRIITQVTDGELDLGGGDFTITLERSRRLQFTLPLVNTKFYVSIQRPTPSGLTWGRFLTPFDTRLWTAMGICILLIYTLMSVISWTHRHRIGKLFIWGSFLEVLGIFCQQGTSPTAPLWSVRVASWAAYLGANTLLAAYSAKIVAQLAVDRTRLPFTSLEGLLDDGTYTLGMVAGSAHYNHFQQAVEPLLTQMYTSLVRPDEKNLPVSPYAGMARVCADPKFAFFSSFELIPNVVDYVNCSVVFVTGASVPESLAMILPRKSPYRRIIDHHLRDMHRTGVLHKLRASTWPSRRSVKRREVLSVGLMEAAPLFMLLLLGVVLSLTVVGTENRRRFARYLHPRLTRTVFQ